MKVYKNLNQGTSIKNYLPAKIKFDDYPWLDVKAFHIEANAYSIIVPYGTPMHSEKSIGPPCILITIEGKVATYVQNKTLKITQQGDIIFIALTLTESDKIDFPNKVILKLKQLWCLIINILTYVKIR